MRTTAGARFVGRTAELAQVRALLAGSRLVTLTGVGGAGKTRIAEYLLAERAAEDPDHCWLVELVDLADATLLGHAIATEVGLQVPGGPWESRRLVDHLADRDALLVLDNCEHLVEPVADLVSTLIASCPRLTILCTSQRPLGLVAESLFPVPPMKVPAASESVRARIAGSDAVALFVDRARTALPTFELTDDNAAVVARLVNELEGLPLAVELAAARIRVLSPAALLSRLSDRDAALGTGHRDQPVRHQTLAASVAWTYDLCTPAEAALWRRLCVFTGGFTLDATESVCSGDEIRPSDVLDLLAGLVDRSVVERVPDGTSRYRMLESIRQFGLARLVAAEERTTYQQRHLDWYAALAAQLEATWFGPGQVAWLELLGADQANLRNALEVAVSTPGGASVALGICYRLQPYWVCTGQFSEARMWSERALAHGVGTHRDLARTFAMCAFMATMQFDLVSGTEMLRQAEIQSLAAADDAVHGYLLYAAGLVRIFQLDVPGGVALLERSVEAFRGTEDIYGLTRALQYAGLNLVILGDTERGIEMEQEVVRRAEAVGEMSVRSYALWTLAMTGIATGELALADERNREALRLSWQLRDPLGIGYRLESIAWVCGMQGRLEYATTVLGAAATIWRRLNIPVDLAPYGWGHDNADGTLSHRVQGPEQYPAAYERGRAFSIQDAVRYALEEPGAGPEQGLDGVLTKRETEVARLVADGLSNREIATRLYLSERTAQGHVQNILRKLAVNSRAQIATWVVRADLD